MEREIKIGKVYQNFLGKKVKVIAVQRDENLESDIVTYENTSGKGVFVTPVDVFMGEVDKSKHPDVKQKYRYELVTSVSINKDSEFANAMLEKVKANGGYCPCSCVKDETTKCMCKEFREQEEGGISAYIYLPRDPLRSIFFSL